MQTIADIHPDSNLAAHRDAMIALAHQRYAAGSRKLLNKAFADVAQRKTWAKIMYGCYREQHASRTINTACDSEEAGVFGIVCAECAFALVNALPCKVQFADPTPDLATRIAPLLAKALTRHASDPAMVERISKGVALVLAGQVTPLDGRTWEVVGSKAGQSYKVAWDHCECPDFTHRGTWCKHLIAAHFHRRLATE